MKSLRLTRGWTALLTVWMLMTVPQGPIGAQQPPAESLPSPEESVTRFAELVLAGDYDAMEPMMAERLKVVITRESAQGIRRELLADGAPVRWSEPLRQEMVGEYTPYHVPVEFERGKIAIRVVLDAAGLVAGLSRAPHPDEKSAAVVSSTRDTGPSDAVAGRWEGTIEAPGKPLPVIVDLAHGASGWTGTFASPLQGASGVPLSEIEVGDEGIAFSLSGVPGKPNFRGRLETGKIEGTFSQAGREFPFRLGREPLAALLRPQDPRPPLPYEEIDVTYPGEAGDLAGTLTVPRGESPFPAVLLLSGSGAQNRDEEVMGHKPFRVIADHLTRLGIAVLRVDDRGVGGSVGEPGSAQLTDLAGDALAGVRFLAQRPEVDAKRIGLLGHSEGGMVAPLAATRSKGIAFVVMMAGPGVPGDHLLLHQTERILRETQVADELIANVRTEQAKLLQLVSRDVDPSEIRAQLGRLVRAQMARPGAPEPTDEQVGRTVDGAVAQVTSPSFRSLLRHDPRKPLRKLRVPVLALWGELDLQVDPDQNLAEVRAALDKAPVDDVTVRALPGLNHMFQSARTGRPDEYASIAQTIDPEVLEMVSAWILERFGKPEPAKG